ncbi:recombinase family protein [Brevundimonas sp. A19_0]|uniref:recombinase family protein n=1 Tax=Brevundimonas sp. A19_0 TaxID=2821087 RepID=UPI001ADBC10B|nr:recombinase family protein [Brevundimonas sp. A19_0]MBO9501191.1 recombinase family protein [Brevundimonas sp. A19_0]
MKVYFAYTRVSTVKQGERGSSLQEQKSAIEVYARKNDLTVAEWFEERETAAKLGRRMFNRMLSALGKEQAAGVIIHKIDRSARNLKDWAHLGELIDRGIEVHFAHESLDLASRGGRLSADIQAVVAADYIRNLRQEVRKGFYGRLKQGFYPLPAPVGYLNRGKAKAKEIDPHQGPLVREAFERYGTAHYSLSSLAGAMRERGLRGRTGRPISKNSLAYILHNPFYMGLIRIERTGETFEGCHKPLVTKAMYDRVQAVMSGRIGEATERHDLLYRRMIRCDRCNRSLIGERQKGHIYYRCHSKTCRGTSIREVDVERDVREMLSALTFDDTELADLQRVIAAANVTQAEDITKHKHTLKMALGRCEDRLTRLTDAYLDATIDRETFDHRKASLLAEKRGLLDALEAPASKSPWVELLEKLELGKAACLRFDSGFIAEKRDALQDTTSNLVADGKCLGFRLKYPFDEVAKWRFSHNGPPFRVEPRKEGAVFVASMVRHAPSAKPPDVRRLAAELGIPREPDSPDGERACAA